MTFSPALRPEITSTLMPSDNPVLISRFANGDFSRIPALVNELVTERVDVLVSRGPTVDYLVSVRSKVPIVFIYSGDPVAAGFADSLPRPGRRRGEHRSRSATLKRGPEPASRSTRCA